MAVVETFFAPAEQAMLPRVVDESDSAELVTANALNGQARNLSRLAGGALGGVAAAIGGIPAVALADAVTFLVAAALLAGIRTSGAVAPRDESAEDVVRGRFAELRDDWVEGAQVALGSRTVRVLATFWLITSFGEGIWGTLFAPYVRSVLESGPQALGLISGIQAVGGVVGGLVVATYGAHWSPRRMLGAGAVVFGVVDLAIALYPLAYVSAWPAGRADGGRRAPGGRDDGGDDDALPAAHHRPRARAGVRAAAAGALGEPRCWAASPPGCSAAGSASSR